MTKPDKDAATIKRLREKIKLLSRRLDAEIAAREQAEERLRVAIVTEHARASRASYGRPPVMYRNGQG